MTKSHKLVTEGNKPVKKSHRNVNLNKKRHKNVTLNEKSHKNVNSSDKKSEHSEKKSQTFKKIKDKNGNLCEKVTKI